MFLSKYGVARHIYIPIVKRAVVDFAVSADWTPAAGDVKISKDGGAAANVTNLPTAITMGNTAIWDFSLTATEMQAAQIVVTVADSATKAVEDQSFIIETYGNASGQHAVDLADSVRAGLTGLANAVPGAAGGLFIAGANAPVTITGSGDALTLTSTAANGKGLVIAGNGSGDGIKSTGGATGAALELVGGGTSGDGLKVTTTSGHGLNIAATGTSMHGITSTGGNGGTSDGIKGVAGTGGVDIRGNITGNLTGNVSGSVGSVTGAVGSVTGNVGGNVTGSIGSVAAGGIATASFAAGAIDAAAIAADAIGASELAANAIGASEIAADALTDAKFDSTGKFRAHLAGVLKLVVGVGSTTTAVVFSTVDGAAASATNDFYKGRVIVFTSGTLNGQATSISSYTGASVTATVVATTSAPANGDTAVIV